MKDNSWEAPEKPESDGKGAALAAAGVGALVGGLGVVGAVWAVGSATYALLDYVCADRQDIFKSVSFDFLYSEVRIHIKCHLRNMAGVPCQVSIPFFRATPKGCQDLRINAEEPFQAPYVNTEYTGTIIMPYHRLSNVLGSGFHEVRINILLCKLKPSFFEDNIFASRAFDLKLNLP